MENQVHTAKNDGFNSSGGFSPWLELKALTQSPLTRAMLLFLLGKGDVLELSPQMNCRLPPF